MDGKTEEFLKTLPPSKELIGTEARKIMTEYDHKKLARKKVDGTIKKEIRKLKLLLENNRTLKNRELENNRNGKLNHFMVSPKFTRQHSKLWKRFESYDCLWEDSTWFGRSIHMTMETKITSNIIPFDVKVCRKKQDTEIVDDRLELASCNRKGSIISCKDETIFEKNLAYYSDSEKGIMQRFLEDIGKTEIINVDEKETAECTMYVINQIDLLQRDRKEIGQDNIVPDNKVVCTGTSKMKSSEILSYTYSDKKKLEKAWKIWRNFTLATKQRGKEREVVGNKIEAFLTRIQERIGVENFVKEKKPGKNVECFKDLKMTNENLNGRMRSRTREKLNEREKNLRKREWNGKEILGEIKRSQKESYERLLTFERRGKREKSKVLKIHANVDKRPKIFPIPKFLLRMEKRREERRNRWKNIRERKKKVEEEREMKVREKEKQMKALEEFSKRKKLQELHDRKKVEEEKRKEEKIKIKLAECHYERTLLWSYGLGPWLYLMTFRKLQQLRSLNFFRKRVLRRVFTKWKIFIKNQVEEKQIKIRSIYHRILQKTCLEVWIKIREERIKQYQAAIDLYDLRITEKIFTKWLKFTQEEQLDYFNKIKIADLHYTKKLKITFLKKWKDYPEFQRFETAKEERKRIWRQKVKEMLPDYRPIKMPEKY